MIKTSQVLRLGHQQTPPETCCLPRRPSRGPSDMTMTEESLIKESPLEVRTGPSEWSRLQMRAGFEIQKRFGLSWKQLRRFLHVPGMRGVSRYLRARAEVLTA